MRHRTTVVALATVVTLLGLAGPATADGKGTPAPAATPTGDGAKGLCKRAGKIDARIDRALKRLNGPVTRRGSIERLEKRVANARAAGHDEIETYLDDRLTFRKSLLPTLEKRRTDLARVRSWCDSHDNGAAS
ncbi:MULTISPECIES: hypothetical protein [Streptomycetaceae]|uniref:hypothetical protein n=1 Tax=Streptomycetaceae TaxID=2062 RepID=UPI0003647953|nr:MULTISPECIES: hypothetical protein [Streptomycetaceae]MYX35825.1 hypothetical protein [Streptomyces sp. SID8377]